ncbi:MAG: guanylate kinase [bacterium]|nr:guanylate kinase [bacterium]
MLKAIVISGPSGVGKTTLINKILSDADLKDKLMFSVSFTTREKRKNEIEGKDYFFVSREKFENMIKNDEFLEWALVHGNFYGTPKSNIQKATEDKKILLLDVDVQGARSIKEKLGKESFLIFIKPPSIEELKRRIIMRKDTKDAEKRLQRAIDEISKAHMFDYVIVNDNLEKAFEEIKRVIKEAISKN